MAKKPTKRSKAKPRRVIKTFQIGLFGGKQLVARRPAPTPAEQARSREFQRESDEYFASTEFRDAMARESAAKAAHQERLSRRPATMRASSYRLPPDVQSFLSKLHDNPLRFASTDGIDTVKSDDAAALIEAAYLRGCTEGYIEGRIADIEPKRERSRKANRARRDKHNLDERDQEIVEKYRRLRAVPLAAGEAQFRLAEEYGLSDKMIRIIIGKANHASR
jgi:hypothetical protein